jgi:hypothetical protein
VNDGTELRFIVDRGEFFRIGRALQRGFGKSLLGRVTVDVRAGVLNISSEWGAGQIACEGNGDVSAQLGAKAFCDLITTRFREGSPSGKMELVFRPATRELAIDRAGVKAKFKP